MYHATLAVEVVDGQHGRHISHSRGFGLGTLGLVGWFVAHVGSRVACECCSGWRGVIISRPPVVSRPAGSVTVGRVSPIRLQESCDRTPKSMFPARYHRHHVPGAGLPGQRRRYRGRARALGDDAVPLGREAYRIGHGFERAHDGSSQDLACKTATSPRAHPPLRSRRRNSGRAPRAEAGPPPGRRTVARPTTPRPRRWERQELDREVRRQSHSSVHLHRTGPQPRRLRVGPRESRDPQFRSRRSPLDPLTGMDEGTPIRLHDRARPRHATTRRTAWGRRLRPSAQSRRAWCPERPIGHDDPTRNTQPPSVPGDSLSHVARARGVDALRKGTWLGQGHGVARTADLERSDRLQALELQEDCRGRVVHRQTYQRRSHNGRGNPLPGGLDVRERNQIERRRTGLSAR